MARKHMQRCSPSLIIRKMQLKPTVRGHLTPIRMATLKTTNNEENSMEVPQIIKNGTTIGLSNSTPGNIPKRTELQDLKEIRVYPFSE